MARGRSRRQVLAVCGTVAASVPLAGAAIEAISGPATGASSGSRTDTGGWRMEQRDPAGTGHAPDASGPRDGVRVRWKQPIDIRTGAAYKPTPVVHEGVVYGVGGELIAVEAASGEVRFRAGRRSRTPPAVVTARAYRAPTLAFARAGGAVGLNARGGRLVAGIDVGLRRWRAGPNGAGGTLLDGPSAAVPVGADGTVFVIGSRGLAAIDASSGRVRWQGDDTIGQLSRPVVRDGTVYLGVFADGIHEYDAETGERTGSLAPPDTRVTAVTAAPDRLLVVASDGLFGVGYDGTEHWRYAPENVYLDGGRVAVADEVSYVGIENLGNDENAQQDGLVAIDATDGTELWRSEAAPAITPQFAPPAVADGVVYVPTDTGELVGVDAADGHVRWWFAPGDRIDPWSPAALVGDTLYVLGNGHLYALEEA